MGYLTITDADTEANTHIAASSAIGSTYTSSHDVLRWAYYDACGLPHWILGLFGRSGHDERHVWSCERSGDLI